MPTIVSYSGKAAPRRKAYLHQLALSETVWDAVREEAFRTGQRDSVVVNKVLEQHFFQEQGESGG